MSVFKSIVFLAACFSIGTITAADISSRRCVVVNNNATVSRIHLSPTCDSCLSQSQTSVDKNNPLAMLVFASDEPTKSMLLAVASRLVAANFRLVIVIVFGSNNSEMNEEHLESTLRNKITSSIPCGVASPVLSFKSVPVKGINGSIPLTSPYDALKDAEAEYQVLEFLVETDELPNVMVLEAANVGGQLVAEKLNIPSVLLAPHSMLALVSEKTAPSTGLLELYSRRQESFLLAGRFMEMNRLRQKLELPLLRNPSDYFEKSTVVLINELAAPSANRILPLYAHFVSPLLPPCLACQETTENNTITVIVSAPELNMADTRVLIRSLVMARADFETFVEETCHPDNPGADIHSEMCLFARQMSEFEVIWEVQNTTVLPELLPRFMSQNAPPAIELLSSYYNNTVAVISHCDSESYPIFALGQRLLCIPSSTGKLESPRLAEISRGGLASLESQSVATALVNMLIDIHDESVAEQATFETEEASWHPVIDGGNLTAQIIEAIATAPRTESTERLREKVNEGTNRTTGSRAHIVSLLVASCAWNVLFVISLCYCLRLVYVTSDPSMTSQTKRFLKSQVVQVVFQHLEELDWSLLFAEKFWWCDESMIHNRVARFLRRYEPEEAQEAEVNQQQQQRPEPKREASGHNARRKRHTRKR